MENASIKKDNMSTILDFIGSAFPGTGYGPDTTAQEVSSILSRNKSIFVKIIPPIVLGWTLIFLLMAGDYLVAGPSDCVGNPGPFLPPFFVRATATRFSMRL